MSLSPATLRDAMNEFISLGFVELNISVGSTYLPSWYIQPHLDPAHCMQYSAWNLENAQAQLLLKDIFLSRRICLQGSHPTQTWQFAREHISEVCSPGELPTVGRGEGIVKNWGSSISNKPSLTTDLTKLFSTIIFFSDAIIVLNES